MKKYTTDYWFTIEPYVYISLTNKKVLLYNTLDRMTIESEQIEVIELLRGIIRKENCGVVLLKYEQYKQKIINDFIREIRNKYMGDIIDVSLSNSKPIQILPYVNFLKDNKIYKEQSFPRLKNIFDNLSEISIFVDMTTDLIKLIPFLQSIPGNQVFNIIGNIGEVKNYKELLFYFNKIPSHKRMIYSYKNIIPLLSIFNNNFSYKISINFPIDMQQWNNSNQILINQSLPVEYIFDVSSENDIQQAEQFVEKYQIIKFQLNPIYTGNNISFFEDNIFFTKDDILSTTISIKDIFIHQSMNIYDYGKINILSNGDVFANLRHPVLGNISTESVHEIVFKEIEEGKSWLNVRNQEPCNECVYQWLCPSPSIFEMLIGRANLCNIKR